MPEKQSTGWEKDIKFLHYLPKATCFGQEQQEITREIKKIEHLFTVQKVTELVSQMLSDEKQTLNIIPKKANIDLKRSIQPKIEKLKRRTERTIIQILNEKYHKTIPQAVQPVTLKAETEIDKAVSVYDREIDLDDEDYETEDEALQMVLHKNQLKVDQHRAPKTPTNASNYLVRLYQSQSILYSKSTSIDKSITRKSIKSVAPCSISRMSSPISMNSFKGSFLQETQILTPKDNTQDLRKEVIELRERLELKEKQIQSLLQGQLLRQYQMQAESFKRERDIIQQQMNNTISKLTKELEINKRNALQVQNAYQDTIDQLNSQIKQYDTDKETLKDLQNEYSKVLLENQSLKQMHADDTRNSEQIREQFELFHSKTLEQKLKLMDCKHYSFVVIQISQYLLMKQSPPLEFLVQLDKMQKQLQVEQNQPLPQGSTLKMVFAQVFSIQIEILLMLTQLSKELKQQVDKYSKQYVSEIGMQLMTMQ